MIERSSREFGEERNNVVERCAHVISDYIPLAEICLDRMGYLRYKTVIYLGILPVDCADVALVHFPDSHHLYNISMPRAAIRVLFIVVLTFLVIAVSVVFSGYYELREASVSDSYAETARHYRNAAQR